MMVTADGKLPLLLFFPQENFCENYFQVISDKMIQVKLSLAGNAVWIFFKDIFAVLNYASKARLSKAFL